ncbi:hypothetical protein [Blastococcus haudaquaticus]|uniref:Uncharacterized protein n=1 Tax=Blastococcus haudaquaticus TaxID=1938745 RepID=A0A286H5W9_9ACTN|nr:hypothetical protein [Blastococcus haudaquaticus]SOE02719.1 hypothetical protein SAMN06272739_3686 [Blastococcus haudaquaticus]
MPSSSSRSRAPARRSPRSAPRPGARPAAEPDPERPLVVPFAAFFGLLVAAEDGYLAWLLYTPEVGWDWFMVGPLVLAALALAGAALVWSGRARGWAVLAGTAVLTLVGLLVLAAFFAVLGGEQAVLSTVLLLVGPVTCLVLALQRPVREWTRGRRPPGGRRTATAAR